MLKGEDECDNETNDPEHRTEQKRDPLIHRESMESKRKKPKAWVARLNWHYSIAFAPKKVKAWQTQKVGHNGEPKWAWLSHEFGNAPVLPLEQGRAQHTSCGEVENTYDEDANIMHEWNSFPQTRLEARPFDQTPARPASNHFPNSLFIYEIPSLASRFDQQVVLGSEVISTARPWTDSEDESHGAKSHSANRKKDHGRSGSRQRGSTDVR